MWFFPQFSIDEQPDGVLLRMKKFNAILPNDLAPGTIIDHLLDWDTVRNVGQLVGVVVCCWQA
jgi:hypothetical protein